MHLRSCTAVLIMAALRSGCGHYIFVLFLSFFPRIISEVADTSAYFYT